MTDLAGTAITDEQRLARAFRLTSVPRDFIDDPYRYYALLREHDPIHELENGALLLTRYDDVVRLYRDPRASSDKKAEFRPKFGASPLYDHHTTSLVFNDPPLHTRVRRLLMGALNQRAIARKDSRISASTGEPWPRSLAARATISAAWPWL